MLASGDQPDVLLDIPNLSVEQLTIEVNNLQVDLALDARLANLLRLTAGAHASIDNVKIDIRGVRAQATLIVRLDNVRAIIERTLQTLDNNPQLVSQLLSTVDNAVGTVGGVANNSVGTVGSVASSLLQNGQLLDLARAGLTEVSRTVNSTGQTVRRVTDNQGQLIEVVTDTATGSSRRAGWGRSNRGLTASRGLPCPVIPAKAGIQTGSAPRSDSAWIPAFAGMTEKGDEPVRKSPFVRLAASAGRSGDPL